MGLQMNLIKNAGMEEGTDLWTAESNATLASDTSEHSGFQELKVTAGANNVGATQELLFEDDSFYEVYGWLRTTAGDAASIWIDKGDGIPVKLTTLSNTTSYTRQSAIFKSEGLPGNIYLRGDNNTDIVWFDDIAVVHKQDLDAAADTLALGEHYVPTRRGKGFFNGSAITYFGAVVHENQWGCVWRGRPQVPYNGGTDYTILEHWADADNYHRLYYDASEDKFTYRKRAAAANYEATTKAMTFSADDEITLICTFDTVDGSQIYFNGSSSGSTAQADVVALATGTTTVRGTAQAGASTTITLASGASASNDAYNSDMIEITAGTGAGQQRKITDYVGSTKVATVNNSWTTNPDSTSEYLIYSSVVAIGGTVSGTQTGSFITDEAVIFTRKITANEAAAIHARNEPLHNHNGAILLSATIAPKDFVEIDCEDLDIQQYDVSAKADVSLLSNGITTKNSRFFQLRPGEKHTEGDIVWCENTTGELDVRYDMRYV